MSFSSGSSLEDRWKILSLPGKEVFRLTFSVHQEHLNQPEAICILAIADVLLPLG